MDMSDSTTWRPADKMWIAGVNSRLAMLSAYDCRVLGAYHVKLKLSQSLLVKSTQDYLKQLLLPFNGP